MNSDDAFLRLATKLGIPSFIRLGIPVRISGWENFPSEDQCTGNSQSLQSGDIILHQRDTIQSAQGHSLIKVTGGGGGGEGPTLTFLPGAVTAVKNAT